MNFIGLQFLHMAYLSMQLRLSSDILQCSASCGRGVKSRKVSCVTGSGRPVPEENCLHLSPKPSKQRRCRGGRCPKWKTGNWGEVGLPDLALKHSSGTLCSHAARLAACFFSSHSSHSTLMPVSLQASTRIRVKTSAEKADCIYARCQTTN